MTSDFQVLFQATLSNRLRYDMISHLRYRDAEALPRFESQRALRLPANANPRTRELALELRKTAPGDRAYVNTVLAMFRNQKFSYTTTPPLLGTNPVDEFLFATLAGYCEHYASAFVVLMRAGGVPARVVTGYQGGELNSVGNYMIVRQADAHAWAEVWLTARDGRASTRPPRWRPTACSRAPSRRFRRAKRCRCSCAAISAGSIARD